jgi:hypothetical protein
VQGRGQGRRSHEAARSLSRVDACNPLLQAHPTWARDEHKGRGISTSLTPVSGHLSPPFALGLAPTHLGWGTQRHFTRRPRDPPVSKRRQIMAAHSRSTAPNRSPSSAILPQFEAAPPRAQAEHSWRGKCPTHKRPTS